MKIKNLDTYFDSPITLAKKFSLRGIPTSILFNKDGFEFARIIGSTDFENKNLNDQTIKDMWSIIDSENTARIQEMHITVGHILCEIVEQSSIGNN